MKARRRRATDHRAAVLEVVATTPAAATRAAVQREAIGVVGDGRFGANQASAMVSTLLALGLLGTRDDGTLFVTARGLDYLTTAAFDLPPPPPYTKPNSRKRTKPQGN